MVNKLLLGALKIDIHCTQCNSYIHSRYLWEYLQIKYDIAYCAKCGIVKPRIGRIHNMTEDVFHYIRVRYINNETLSMRLSKFITSGHLVENVKSIADFVRSGNQIELISTYDVYSEAIDIYPMAISEIEHPSVELQMKAVEKDISVYKYISKPDPLVSRYVQKNAYKGLEKVFKDIEQW